MGKKSQNPRTLLKAAVKAGLTFGDCVEEFSKKNTSREEYLIEKAREEHHRDGELEIDDMTITSGSEGDGGDYVLAWVWVNE